MGLGLGLGLGLGSGFVRHAALLAASTLGSSSCGWRQMGHLLGFRVRARARVRFRAWA